MTPEGDNDQRDDDTDGETVEPVDPSRPGSGRPVASDFGWGRSASAQPPGERITWEALSAEVSDGDAPAPPGDLGAGAPPRAQTLGSPASSGPTTPAPPVPARPAPPAGADPTPAHLRVPRAADPAPAAPPARPTPAFGRPSSAADEPAPRPTPTWGSDAERPGAPATLRGAVPAKPERPSGFAFDDSAAPPRPSEPAAAPPAPSAPTTPPPPAAAQPAPDAIRLGPDVEAELRGQISALARRAAAAERSEDRRAEREAITELAAQLAAAQTQIAGIGSQLTTLSHRISYDLERGAQTTSERILRDLSDLPAEVSLKVGGDLGPAIDDLTDQVETDLAKISAAVEALPQTITPRLTSIGAIVDGLPLSNVEILNALQGVNTDLEDHLARFATRINDQLAALERSHAAELTRLRGQLDDLRIASGRTVGGPDAFERMAGQVERLAQRTPGSEDIVESLELLVSEHLDVLRDNIDARVGGLGPLLQEELAAVRAEALGGLAAAEEGLAERIDTLEASLVERLDVALGDQIDAMDAVVAERQAELLGAVSGDANERVEELNELVGGNATRFDELAEALAGTGGRIDELAETVAGTSARLDEIVSAVAELQETISAGVPVSGVAVGDGDGDGGAAVAQALAAVSAELKALKRRISLRADADESSALTPEQVAALAAQIADHLH